jgi:hypothetical protein
MNYQVILLPLTVFYCIMLYLLGWLAIRDYILLVIYLLLIHVPLFKLSETKLILFCMHVGVPRRFLVFISLLSYRGTRWRSWLRHCTTSRKVMVSIPDVVIAIFHWHNPSGRTMALGSTQPLTEISTRNIAIFHWHNPSSLTMVLGST